jgi:hypothetical protein
MQDHDHVGRGEAVIRLLALCLFPLLLALPAAADCLDDIKAELAAIRLKLASGSIPPDAPPVVPATVTPTKPPAIVTVTSGPSCNPGGPYVLDRAGTIYNVCTCSPAVVQIRNAGQSAAISWAKMPGTGTPSVPLGIVRSTLDGQATQPGGGTSTLFDVGPGNHTVTFTADVPCTNLAVQLR